MSKLISAAILASMMWIGQAAANSATPAKCRVAEVNPVTNHAHCIDPIGATLDVQTEKPCQGMRQTAPWTMTNGCDTAPPAKPPSS
jgi:hypothetical protein